MKTIITSLFAVVMSFTALQAHAYEFVEGKDYVKVANVDPALNNKTIEIFSYHCQYCYRSQNSVHAFKASMPKGMVLEHKPTTFGYKQLLPFASTYFIMEELGLTDELHDYAFHIAKLPIKGEKHYNKLNNFEGVKAFFMDHGVSEADYEKAVKAIEEKGLIKQADKFASKYQVEGTPTFIINGKYIVTDYKKGPKYDKYFTALLLHVANL